MKKPTFRLNPGPKVDCKVAEGTAEWASPNLSSGHSHALPMASLSPSTISALFLSRLPTRALGRGLRQRVHTAWERPKCHFNLIINMCRRGRDPSNLGLWGHWTVKSLWQNPFAWRGWVQITGDYGRLAWLPSWPFIPHGREWLCLERILAQPGASPSLAMSISWRATGIQRTYLWSSSDNYDWWPHQHNYKHNDIYQLWNAYYMRSPLIAPLNSPYSTEEGNNSCTYLLNEKTEGPHA